MANGKIETYDEAARAIALYLQEFCDDKLPYFEMMVDAAIKANTRIAVLERRLKNISTIATMQLTD